MYSDSKESQDMISTLFTMTALGVGLMTFLYNRIVTMMSEMREDVRSTQDGLHDLNENVNQMYLRLEASPVKDTSISEEVETDKYQAWIGTRVFENANVWVCIVRNMLNTAQENTEWMEWQPTKDASTVVRDYYYGSFESEDWKITKEGDGWIASSYETMIDGWSSFIRVYVRVAFTGALCAEAKPVEAYNQMFLNVKNEGRMDWRRELTLTA